MQTALFINRVYPPSAGATGQLLSELAEHLARDNWSVTVLTSRCDRADDCAAENNVRVVRVARATRRGESFWRRAAGYVSLYPRFLWRALRLPRADLVITMTDPPLLVFLGPLISWLKGSRHVHWAQDLYPELAEELGVLRKGGLLASLLRWISTASIRQATTVIAIGECMKQRLILRGIPPDNIAVIPNWGSCGPVEKVEQVSEFRRSQGWDNRFVVMYSGNLGLAHTFDAIVDAAERLQWQAPHVIFAFVGDGPRAQNVREMMVARGLNNMTFLPAQPKARLEISLAAADLHLASMRDELCGLIVPSKVYGALAAARPCFFIGPHFSETAQLLAGQKLGRVFGVSGGAALADSVVRWSSEPMIVEQAKERLRSLAGQFRIEPAAGSFSRVLASAITGRSRAEAREPAKGGGEILAVTDPGAAAVSSLGSHRL